ncbi:MAG: glycine--tRNA ligase subunit beta, partial [Planctomycetota bacterium]
SHQRYFPFKTRDGKLLNRFITVSNITANKEIKEGNERVIKARLSDALFFWEQDRKTPLEEYAKRLDSIAFLGKLGTMKEKSVRLKELALFISEGWCDNKAKQTIGRAAELCKADLLTGMVGEFPDLQGIMGYEYLKDKEPGVALAIKEHYQPRFANDQLPESKAGICLALAEKFDNLVSVFSIGEKPTGSSDPYGLRRQALGIIKIIIANKLNLSLNSIWNKALGSLIGSVRPFADEVAKLPYPEVQEFWKAVAHTHQILDNHRNQIKNDLNKFIEARLYQILDEEEHINQNIFNAVLFSIAGLDNLYLFQSKLNVLVKLSKDSIWNELVEVVERTHNISKNLKVEGDINETLLKEKEEIELWNAYKDNEDAIQKLIDAEQYEEASHRYHQVFAKPAQTFFEKVFVNVTGDAEKDNIRNNRLLLLKKINQLYSSGIADLSRIPRK